MHIACIKSNLMTSNITEFALVANESNLDGKWREFTVNVVAAVDSMIIIIIFPFHHLLAIIFSSLYKTSSFCMAEKINTRVLRLVVVIVQHLHI